jgi:hypothetical protein
MSESLPSNERLLDLLQQAHVAQAGGPQSAHTMRAREFVAKAIQLLSTPDETSALTAALRSVAHLLPYAQQHEPADAAEMEAQRLVVQEAERALAGHVRQLETSAARTARETIEVLSRWIVQRGQDLRDHACPQCVPEGGDLVNPSYVCAFHLAQEYARTPVKASCRHVFDFIPFMGIVCTKCAVEATTETIPPGHSTHHWVEQGAGMICDGCGLIRGPQPLPSDK